MLSPRRVRARDDAGAVAIIVAFCAVLLFVIGALVVDLGFARDVRRQSQNAADASSLAAGNVLYPTSGMCTADPAPGRSPCFVDAGNAARAYALVNFGVSAAEWTGCRDPSHFYVLPGSGTCISFTDETLAGSRPSQPTKVRVVIPTRTLPTGLGALADVSTISIGTSARASLRPGEARSCGLCLLGPGVSGLGNGDVIVSGGSVFSNGGIDTGPQGHITATPAPNTITTVLACTGNCSPAAQTGAIPIDDPYEALALPPDLTALSPKTDPCAQGQGIYPAFELPNSTCTLSPGLYVLTGMWTMKNNSVLNGNGVTIYGTCGSPRLVRECAAGQAGGGLDTKNGRSNIVARTTGVLAGFGIVYDRQNTSALNIQGNGDSFLTGAIYALNAVLEFPGTTTVTVTNGPIIVRSLYGNGNTGRINLMNSLAANIPAPPNGVSLDQ